MDIKDSKAVQKLSLALSIATDYSDDLQDKDVKFKVFHNYLEQNFPLFHEKVSKEVVREYALMYKWESAKNVDKSLPFALLAHMDVVGIEEGTENDWKYPPFSGTVADEYIWGRGALDDKGSLVGILEAAEKLISENYEPDRDIYFCFSYNEEGVGKGDESGAQAIATLLEERDVRFEFVLDEGGAVITDSFMGLTKPIATIGLAEKGCVDLKISVTDSGGHSSTPPNDTTITKLADLIVNYKEINDKNIVFTDTLLSTLKAIGNNIQGFSGYVLRHPTFFNSFVKRQLLKDNQTAAMIRTSVAPTVLRAGKENNVLPQKAEAVVNIRIIPGEDTSTIESRIRDAAGVDTSYTLEYLSNSEPLPETPGNTETYKLLSKLTQEIHGAIPLPYLVVALTDSREYKNISNEIYRFCPVSMSLEELSTIHSTNERVKVNSYLEEIEFYKRFIEESGKR